MDYLKFEFSSMNNRVKNMNYYVYSESIRDLQIFFRQHNFRNVPQEAVTIYPSTGRNSIIDLRLLKPFKFKSNKTNEIYTVMTCDEFVNIAMENVANEIAQFSLFGEAIMRRDIDIFKIIGDNISKLPHAHITDYVLADEYTIFRNTDSPDDSFDKDIRDLDKNYLKRIGAPTEDQDSRMVLESLHDAVDHSADDIYPITLECYVSNFTEMMVDAFN